MRLGCQMIDWKICLWRFDFDIEEIRLQNFKVMNSSHGPLKI